MTYPLATDAAQCVMREFEIVTCGPKSATNLRRILYMRIALNMYIEHFFLPAHPPPRSPVELAIRELWSVHTP